jgi:hypothetical protein
MRESDIEKKVCDYAKLLGYQAYKFSSPARAAVPDRLFLSPNGNMFFIEFKAPGKHPTPAQVREHERIEMNKGIVYVVDDVDIGKRIVENWR